MQQLKLKITLKIFQINSIRLIIANVVKKILQSISENSNIVLISITVKFQIFIIITNIENESEIHELKNIQHDTVNAVHALFSAYQMFQHSADILIDDDVAVNANQNWMIFLKTVMHK